MGMLPIPCTVVPLYRRVKIVPAGGRRSFGLPAGRSAAGTGTVEMGHGYSTRWQDRLLESLLPQALFGSQHQVPSLARVDQFRRRLGVPESTAPPSSVQRWTKSAAKFGAIRARSCSLSSVVRSSRTPAAPDWNACSRGGPL